MSKKKTKLPVLLTALSDNDNFEVVMNREAEENGWSERETKAAVRTYKQQKQFLDNTPDVDYDQPDIRIIHDDVLAGLAKGCECVIE